MDGRGGAHGWVLDRSACPRSGRTRPGPGREGCGDRGAAPPAAGAAATGRPTPLPAHRPCGCRKPRPAWSRCRGWRGAGVPGGCLAARPPGELAYRPARTTWADRPLLSALGRVLSRRRWGRVLVCPETVLRWSRDLVARRWTYPRAVGVRRRRRPRSASVCSASPTRTLAGVSPHPGRAGRAGTLGRPERGLADPRRRRDQPSASLSQADMAAVPPGAPRALVIPRARRSRR